MNITLKKAFLKKRNVLYWMSKNRLYADYSAYDIVDSIIDLTDVRLEELKVIFA